MGAGKAAAGQLGNGHRGAVDGHALDIVQTIGIAQGKGARGKLAART